jgi:hypothetical protein
MECVRSLREEKQAGFAAYQMAAKVQRGCPPWLALGLWGVCLPRAGQGPLQLSA